jgi:hypothetical protein
MRLPSLLLTLTLLGLSSVPLKAQTAENSSAPITNPTDIDFRAHLVGDSHAYHMGEPIEIEISYSSNAEKKYQTSRTNPNSDWSGVSPHPTPSASVTNLRQLRQDLIGGFALSMLSGGPEFITTKPITERLELSFWYRFQNSGHYSVNITSDVVSHIKTLEEGGGRQNLKLESNAVEFEILPPDPAWEAQELESITQALDAAKSPGERYAPIHRLAALGTPAATDKLLDLFLANPSDHSEGNAAYTGLRESSRGELVIPRLQAALSNPSGTVPQQLPELLAVFQTRQELGILALPPTDPAEHPGWEQKFNAGMKVRDKYLARANDQLLASIKLRTGPQRAQALYQAWSYAQQLNVTSPQPPDLLNQLRQEVLDVERELTPSQQLQIVTSSLRVVPHEQLLPIIRDLAGNTGPEAVFIAGEAFPLWCNDQLAQCSAEIFQRASKSDPVINQHIIFLMPETEHPELDAMFQEKLADPKIIWQAASGVNFSSFVLRAGSKNLVSSVDAALNVYAKDRKFECEPQAYFLGYLFRFAPKDAASRLTAIMQAPSDPCGNQMLRYLDLGRYSDDLIPIAIQALNSPNFSAAGLSATFLAARAPESAKAALWQRLDALQHDWRDRAAELQAYPSVNPTPDKANDQTANQVAMLEEALTSALASATNWKLTDSERNRLRDDCLTERCRTIADGNMHVSM